MSIPPESLVSRQLQPGTTAPTPSALGVVHAGWALWSLQGEDLLLGTTSSDSDLRPVLWIASHRGYLTQRATSSPVAAGGDARPPALPLEPAATLSGTVTTPGSDPVGGALVRGLGQPETFRGRTGAGSPRSRATWTRPDGIVPADPAAGGNRSTGSLTRRLPELGCGDHRGAPGIRRTNEPDSRPEPWSDGRRSGARGRRPGDRKRARVARRRAQVRRAGAPGVHVEQQPSSRRRTRAVRSGSPGCPPAQQRFGSKPAATRPPSSRVSSSRTKKASSISAS